MQWRDLTPVVERSGAALDLVRLLRDVRYDRITGNVGDLPVSNYDACQESVEA
jgi:hypothetical protein